MIHQNLMPNVSYMIHAIKSHQIFKFIKYSHFYNTFHGRTPELNAQCIIYDTCHKIAPDIQIH